MQSNFSVASSSLLTHTEVVDYADQNANFPTLFPASTYTSFTTPYSKYRIALFLTSMVITATSTIPFSFDITTAVLSATTYSMAATLGYSATITTLQFSQVFFDSSQFSLNSGKYLNFQELSVTNTATTSFFTFNNALQYNFMMGLKSFSAVSGQCLLDYQWTLTTVSGNYGSQIQVSTSYIAAGCALSGDVSTILLMMKWSCPGGYPYFDLTSQTCLASCNPYTYLNATDSSCYPCLNTACYTCNSANSNICLTCATNFQVVNNTCICDTSTGAYQLINGVCYSCNDLQSKCALCSYSGNTSIAYNSANFMCLTCDAAAGYFIDPNNLCMTCSVANCATCLGYSFCSVCNAGYGVTVSGSCSTCPITGCQTCVNLTVCSTCVTGYNKISGLCYTCPSSCTCGGYTLPKYANGDCSTVCGDGIVIFPYEACDDGNTADGDGCSAKCAV
jgi:cysteine-rich repeat protein